MFPKIAPFLSQDTEKPFLQYAVVLNGILQATDNKIAYYGSVEILTADPKQRDLLEKKIFNQEDLEILANSVRVDFRSDGFKAYFEDGKSKFRIWAGTIDAQRQISLYDDLMDEYALAKDFKKYPDMTQILSAISKNSDIDVKAVQRRNTHFRSVSLPAQKLAIISEAFMFKDPSKPFVRLEFFHADQTKDKVDKVTAAILVTPLNSNFNLYKEAALLMPVF